MMGLDATQYRSGQDRESKCGWNRRDYTTYDAGERTEVEI